ncbi:hypothetical protein [Aeromicrobium sp. UC242_57]
MNRTPKLLVAAAATLLIGGVVTSGPATAGGEDPSPRHRERSPTACSLR